MAPVDPRDAPKNSLDRLPPELKEDIVDWAGTLGGDPLLAALSATTTELRRMANRIRWRVVTLDSSARKLRLFSVAIAPVHGHLVKHLRFHKDRRETSTMMRTRRGQNRYHAVVPILPHFTNLEHFEIELYQGFDVRQVLNELVDVFQEVTLPITAVTLTNASHISVRGAWIADFLSALPKLSYLHLGGITIRDEELHAEEGTEAQTGWGVFRAAITALSGLKKLVLDDLPAPVLQGLQLNCDLEELDVRHCTDVDLAALRTLAMQVRSTLRTLTFISDAETSPFFPTFQLTHLSTLNIDAPLPFFVFSGFSSSPLHTLRSSRLSPEVTDEDDEDFAALEQVMEENRASLKRLEVRLPEVQEGEEEVWRNDEAWERLAASCQRRGVQLKLGGAWWEERDFVWEFSIDIIAPSNF